MGPKPQRANEGRVRGASPVACLPLYFPFDAHARNITAVIRGQWHDDGDDDDDGGGEEEEGMERNEANEWWPRPSCRSFLVLCSHC